MYTLRKSFANFHMWTPVQNVKGSINAALSGDAANGASAGLQQLEAAVSTNWTNLLVAKDTTPIDKMKEWVKPLADWLRSEPRHPLRAFEGNKGGADEKVSMSVHWHTTFGQLCAQVRLHGCVCAQLGGPTSFNSACGLHGPQVALPDLLWEVIRVVHNVFDDKFMSFANVFLDESVKGRVGR